MNTKSQQNSLIWRKKYVELEEKYKSKETEYKKLANGKEERKLKESKLKTLIGMLKKGEAQFEWDETILNIQPSKINSRLKRIDGTVATIIAYVALTRYKLEYERMTK